MNIEGQLYEPKHPMGFVVAKDRGQMVVTALLDPRDAKALAQIAEATDDWRWGDLTQPDAAEEAIIHGAPLERILLRMPTMEELRDSGHLRVARLLVAALHWRALKPFAGHVKMGFSEEALAHLRQQAQT